MIILVMVETRRKRNIYRKGVITRGAKEQGAIAEPERLDTTNQGPADTIKVNKQMTIEIDSQQDMYCLHY